MARIIRSSLKLTLVLAAAVFIIAALGPADSAPVEEERNLVIDTDGPVTMAKCEPCHRDLQKWKNPKLINFNHPVHFKRDIGCPVCHTVFPHQPGKTIKPTMDLCANCHRQKHGNQGQTAAFKCELCHPPDFKLTPDDHDSPAFSGSGHVEKTGNAAQKCLVCHTGKSCENCHEEKGVKTERRFRWYGLWPVEKGKGEKIKIGGKVDMASCQACHRDLQKWDNPKLISFNHPTHFKRQVSCDKCHYEWPHLVEEIRRPKMTACAQCHRLDHGNQGPLVAAESPEVSGYCFLCHPKDMELRPGGHTTEFVEGDHSRFAQSDRGLCRMCHARAFCDGCHQAEIPHGPDWGGEHGRVAASLQGQGDNLSCFKCHKPEGPQTEHQKARSCAKCHRAVVFPHKEPWAPLHGKLAEELGVKRVCETCHIKENFCDECHDVKLPHNKKTWLAEHRIYVRDNSADACMKCHVSDQCEKCHVSHKVHRRHTNYDFGVD